MMTTNSSGARINPALVSAKNAIDRLIPDGFDVLVGLKRSRSVTEAEWNDLHAYYGERVEEFYEAYQAVWDSLEPGDRIILCERAGLCQKRIQQFAISKWNDLTPASKRKLWLPIQRTYHPGARNGS